MVDFREVQSIVAKLPLKSGPGPDGVPPHCLKYGGDVLVEALVDIARESLQCGYIPECLKAT